MTDQPVFRPVSRCVRFYRKGVPEACVQEQDAMLGFYGAMLANCQNVVERFTDCTSVFKEVRKDFLNNF